MTYDAAGNITYDARLAGGFGYAYNAANRMEEVTKDGILQASYLYNAEGQQVVRALAGGQTIHSMHNLDGQRIAEYGATGALLREYIWMGWMPVAVIESGQIHYIRTDHIERPVFATDATGTKVWDATYRPFGGVHTSTGTSEIRFLGQWFQSESGLHQNWMRDYDPTTGRYIQADPLGLVDGASVYGYAGQSPGRYVDPTGTLGQACLVPGVGQAACAKFVEVCVTAGTAALRYAFRKAVALGGSVILNNDCSGDGCGNADEEEVEEEGEDGDDFYDWTPHAEDAMMDEDISPDDVYDAIENPINVRSGSSSKGPTQVYEGKRATAVVNGDGVIVTVWR